MKLLVVSDSHGSKEELMDLSRKYQSGVDAMIHCGDSELSADDPALSPYLVVRGNCDMDARLPDDLVEKVGGHSILVTHGHHYGIKMSLMKLRYRAEEAGAQFVFFGHSHTLGAELNDGTLFLNPGSILLPRGRSERTYALVEAQDQEIKVTFLTHDHVVLDELTQTFNL
ncbi:YfcE family phosphodiesterase [Bacillus sp. AFS015802]|uniref:metallophosphoesterase n=1 Tax=Bacillus sp. AFS015802 TaxID=2033486 RepID=UPI000BF2A6C7|nr:metallophosphoesterase [Bacillus sp. AFS015802]PFA61877.1 YfcE family phosphodiesterase [Bacillus sp. AFS015802]